MPDHHFPVAKSFMSAEALATALQSAYGLCEVRCQLIQATMRDVYLVTSTHQNYILFVYRHAQRTCTEITGEWNFIEYLHARNLPVAPAIPQENGEILLTLTAPEGIRYAVLSTFIEGKHLRHRYSAEAVRLYGQLIGQLHALADEIPDNFGRPRNDFHAIVQKSLAALAPLLSHRPADMSYLSKIATLLQPRFEELPKKAPYYGMIHGDVIRANAQISDDGNVTVLDFDLCGTGWRAYDIASYLEVAGTDEAKQAFLDGYQKIRKLTDHEWSLLPIFEATRHIFSLGVPAMNIYHWGRACLTDTMIDASINGLKECMSKIGP